MKGARRVIQLRSYALAFAVALSPAFFQISYSCERGNTFLLSLELEVSGQDQIVNFSTTNRSYAVTTSSSTAVLRVVTQDPASIASYRWLADGTAIGPSVDVGVGGGEVTVTVPEGQTALYVGVRAPEGAFDNYIVDVDRVPETDPDPVTATIPMYCTENVFANNLLAVDFELTVDAFDLVVAGQPFDASITGFANLSASFYDFIAGAVPEVITRVAVDDSVVVAYPRSGASGPSLNLAIDVPTTCTYDASGSVGLGAGPFPPCDPANDTGDGGNSECIGLGGAPNSFDACRSYHDTNVIDGIGDACAACNALGSVHADKCASYDACAVLGALPLTTETATFVADPAPTAGPLFGFEEAAVFPPVPDVYPPEPPGLVLDIGELVLLSDCFMGSVTDQNPMFATLIPAPDSALVSLPLSSCPFVCGDGIKDSCEECDDGNNVDGDGCQADCTIDYCTTDPVDCSATAECLTDGVCDPGCEPGTGCDRCPGQDQLMADGTSCGGGSGTCQSGVCEPNPPTASIQWLGAGDCRSNGTTQPPCALSDDGKVAVFGNLAVWKRYREGFDLDEFLTDSFIPNGITATGDIVAGTKRVSQDLPYKWTESGGFQALPSSVGNSWGGGMTADGNWVAGQVGYGGFPSFVIGPSGFQYLPGGNYLNARAIVGNGDPFELVDSFVVVGSSSNLSTQGVVVWTYDKVLQQFSTTFLGAILGTPSGCGAVAMDATYGGDVIVGGGAGWCGTAWRWDAVNGFVDLGTLGLPGAMALEVDNAGSRIVGTAATAQNFYEAFLWESGTGIRRMADVLLDDHGVMLDPNVVLQSGDTISGDGQTILGTGIDPAGAPAQIFLITLGAP